MMGVSLIKISPRIKICGITREADARLAVGLGADYLGLITYRKSPRFVSQRIAKSIVASVAPTVQFVLVFVNEAPAKVIDSARRLRCSIVQLHGAYSAKDVAMIQRSGLKVIRALQVGSVADVKRARTSKADFVLLDSKDSTSGGRHGGTGQAFDWELLKSKASRPANLVVAGGLSIDNFAEALDLAGPMVLDFNSGVESSPGVKSAVKLKRLFAALHKRRSEYVS